ncbi:DUF5677 domain-containing protein [Burkholderia pseudomallei]|uniref:DUF5677 domain-containing protein n=2 Tax=Burkholderia pseudomallei TaxID=28450 RepID=UPI00050E2D8C|nr:DUF5677 domain-containing protein [Burkholderia pseudomallei]KGC40435.1 hypothetical protein DO73_3480 [Burkholderia pseudomallei]KGD12756.1 hypothetical protein DP42_2512 [Burkholderia pseudomallei]
MPIDRRLVLAGCEANRAFEEILVRMEMNDTTQARAAAMLVASIAEMANAAMLLMGMPLQSHALVLLRSMLEALVDLKCLIMDDGYLDQLEFDDALQLVRVFRDFAAVPGFMDDEERRQQLGEMRAQTEARYEALRPGRAEISTRDLFARAGMAGDYVAYRTYCSYTHNKLFALRGRHGARGRVLMGESMPVDMQRSAVTNAVSMYARALEVVPAFTTNVTADEVRETIRQVDEIINNALPPRWGQR